MNKGLLYAIGAYVIWGILPVFWKALQTVPAVQIVAHRMVWSLVFAGTLLLFQPDWSNLLQNIKHKKILLIYFSAGCVLLFNWFIYVWAVNAGHVVEASLGYFISPLVYVLLGVLLFQEKLRLWQWVAVGVATTGVLYLTFIYGVLPWIALALACTFGVYGLVKKTAPLNALDGLFLESALLFFPALLFLLYQEKSGAGAFGHVGLSITILLILTGVATGLPLLWFAVAAQRIRLSTVGILQYIAPLIQFLLGVLVYGEPLTQNRLIGFAMIWVALLIFSVEGAVERRKATTVQYAN